MGHLLIARHVHYTKHLDTNTSSKNSVYIVQLYGLPVCPKLKIAKSGHRLCRKGLIRTVFMGLIGLIRQLSGVDCVSTTAG